MLDSELPEELRNSAVYDTDLDDDETSETTTLRGRQKETLVALGSGFSVGGVDLPPPVSGVLPLLQVIDSPFVPGAHAGEPTLRNVLETLYVLKHREKALEPVFGVARAKLMLEATEKIAGKSPEFYREYVTAVLSASRGYGAFDAAVFAFGEELGVFQWEEAAEAVAEYIACSMGGFEMIPTKDGGSKKAVAAGATSSRLSGSPTSLRWWQRCCLRLLGMR